MDIITTSDVKLCDNPTPLDIAKFMVQILDIKKAKDIKLIHVEERTIIADYYVICTGNSKTQISSLSEEVEFRLSQFGVKIIHTEGGLSLTFEDKGFGMTPNEQKNLFRMFYRGIDHNENGHGIGMALVQRIMALHKAKLEVSSKEGHGTKFLVDMT